MTLDFQKINQEKAGYHMYGKPNPTPEGPPVVFGLGVLTFGEFIPPYAYEAESPQRVYDNLEASLAIAIEQQDSVTNGERSVMLEVLARSALKREAIMNSMRLIKDNYL